MNKTVFITGTSTGFGKLTAITLANEGYHVIAGMRAISGKNKTVATELGTLPNIEVAEIDVSDGFSVTNAFEKQFKSMVKSMYWSTMPPFQVSDCWKLIVWTKSGKDLK